MIYYKADHITGRIERVEAKILKDKIAAIGNTRYEKSENIYATYCSFHVRYIDAKDALISALESQLSELRERQKQVEDTMKFAKNNL